MPDSVLGKIAVEIGGGTAANGGGGGSPSSSSISGGGDADTKKNLGLLSNMRQSLGSLTKSADGQPRFWTKALKTMGIQVGLAGILKQSQIFTSTLGSLFQILGAFVDVILAPWMPPRVKKWSENVYKWATETMGPWLMKWGGKLKDGIEAVTKWIGEFFKLIFSPEKWAPKFTELSTKLKAWWKEIEWTNFFKDLAGGIKDMLGALWNKLVPKKFLGIDLPRYFKEGEKGPGTGPGGGPSGDDENLYQQLKKDPLSTALDIAATGQELGEDFIEAVGDSNWMVKAGSVYAAAFAARLAATPLKIVTEAAAPGIMKKPLDVAFDAMKKPHQIMNFLAKNTGKAMAATFGAARGVVKPQSTTSMFDDFLDELYDPNTGKRQIPTKPKPKGKGILDFSKRVGGFGGEAGEVVGERGAGRVKPVVSAAQKITVETYRKAISKAEEFRGWLAQIKPGESNLVQKANARMKVLWGAFGNIAHLPGGAAMRPAFSLLTRFAKFLIPGLATTFVVRETQYEIDKMMASDMPWLKDPGDIKAWAADAGVLGAGAAAGATSPMHGGIAQMLNIGPWGKDKEMGQASQMYMEAQAAHFQTGALSQGKLAPILMRLLGGGLEAGGSLLGAPGLAVSGAGFTMNELARQRMGMGLGTGQGYAEQQLINDLKMLIPGWGTQKVTIDGQAGESYYTTGAEN